MIFPLTATNRRSAIFRPKLFGAACHITIGGRQKKVVQNTST